jgi:hypothetical protein
LLPACLSCFPFIYQLSVSSGPRSREFAISPGPFEYATTPDQTLLILELENENDRASFINTQKYICLPCAVSGEQFI